MPLQLIQDQKYMMKRSAVDRRAVIEHLRLVLAAFAMKGQYTQFYIGITRDIDARLYDHQKKKPQFSLMVPIYEEPGVFMSDSFDFLERDAINAFRKGVVHPTTGKQLLTCANGPGAATPKTTLYVLIG